MFLKVNHAKSSQKLTFYAEATPRKVQQTKKTVGFFLTFLKNSAKEPVFFGFKDVLFSCSSGDAGADVIFTGLGKGDFMGLPLAVLEAYTSGPGVNWTATYEVSVNKETKKHT